MKPIASNGTDMLHVGDFRRFGPYGPVYEILGFEESLKDGETMLRIELPATGERAIYPYSDARLDPTAD